MARKITRKELKHDEFVEAGLDVGEWLEENWRTVALAAGGALVVALLFVGWSWWGDRRQARAERLAAEGFTLLDAATADPAAAAAKFEEAQGVAGGSPLGEVARTYRGIALLRAGRAAEAVPLLEEASGATDDPVLRGTAKALLAEALDAAGNADRAAEVYRGLADVPTPSFPPELALVRLGEVRARQGRMDDARGAWQDVVARYPESPYAALAGQLLSQPGSAPAQ
jgi:predicted negative regulator of RcsB-dependent stress response